MGDVIRLNTKGWLTTRQAAEMMGVSVRYIYRLNSGGYLEPAGRVGSLPLYRESDIEAYMAAHPNVGKNRKIAV